MQPVNLSYETSYAVLRNISEFVSADFDALGITPEDFELCASAQPWRREHMGRTMRTMNALLFGTLEIQGVPKIIVPSEYVAAVISAFVHPANIMNCCIWMAQERQTGIGALDLASRQATAGEVAPTSGEQLFSLCCLLLVADRTIETRANFRRRLGLAVEQATLGVQ